MPGYKFSPSGFQTRFLADRSRVPTEASAEAGPKRMQLTKIQNDFFESKAIFRGFTGGRGAGKTHVGALDLICRMLESPQAPMLMGQFGRPCPE